MYLVCADASTYWLLWVCGIIFLKYSIKRIKQHKLNTFWKLQGWNLIYRKSLWYVDEDKLMKRTVWYDREGSLIDGTGWTEVLKQLWEIWSKIQWKKKLFTEAAVQAVVQAQARFHVPNPWQRHKIFMPKSMERDGFLSYMIKINIHERVYISPLAL